MFFCCVNGYAPMRTRPYVYARNGWSRWRANGRLAGGRLRRTRRAAEPIDESLSRVQVVIAGEELACRSEFIQPRATFIVDAHQSRLRSRGEQIP